MKDELSITQNKLSKDDLILSLIAKRELALSLIRTSKNQFVCRDRYKQVKKINEKLRRMGVEK